MALLRSENGCPWDREQTHRSIRQNVIEEAYEVADAIDRQDASALCEELGDLLLQVVFHSRMAQEAGTFDFDDVADGICKKLIGRHPHIFGNTAVGSAQEMYALWDRIKVLEKGQTSAAETLRAVPASFPSLMRAQKLCSRTERAGFQSAGAGELFAELHRRLEDAGNRTGEGKTIRADEFGTLFFALAALARRLGVDAEEALSRTCGRYVERFERMEACAEEQKQELSRLPCAQSALWESGTDGTALPNNNTEESEK